MGGFGTQIPFWSMNYSSGAPAQDSYTKLLYHFNSDYTDSSGNSHNSTTVGSIAISTTASKFGAGSLYIPENYDAGGNGQHYTTTADSDDWNFGTGDFTIDWWWHGDDFANLAGGGTGIIGQRVDGNNFWHANISSPGNKVGTGINALVGGSWVIALTHTSTNAPAASSKWFHIAVVRSGNTWYQFIDGVLQTNDLQAGGYSGTMPNLAAPLRMPEYGAWNSHRSRVDEMRISKGIARWTTGFTPPTSPY